METHKVYNTLHCSEKVHSHSEEEASYCAIDIGDVLEFLPIETAKLVKKESAQGDDYFVTVLKNGKPWWFPVRLFRSLLSMDIFADCKSDYDCVVASAGKTITYENASARE